MGAHNLIGQRFGKLLVIERAQNKPTNKHAQWLCKCNCGNEKVYPSHKLKSGEVKACGCLQGIGTHGETGSQMYVSWLEMKTRCYNKNRKGYHRYGGRGIRVCDRWLNSFENFKADVPEPTDPTLTLDRINNDGDYEPGNVRWATKQEQACNTSRNRYVETPQGKMRMLDAVKVSGLPYSTIQYRLNHNWPSEKLFEKPL